MYYTRTEVADLLNISKVTVYHYSKQKKIRKVPDPHRTMREARYYKEEVDALAKQRNELKIEGYTTSELGKKLGVTQKKIYQLINEHNLFVHQVPHGDERIRYIIPEETAAWMKEEIERTAPIRGIRSEFYDSTLDIALFQLFFTKDKYATRVLRNTDGEWGFYNSTRSWVPFELGVQKYGYSPAYEIHRPLLKASGYTDLVLPKGNELSFLFLDYMYVRRGIENIRLREHDDYLALSIKSGPMQVTDSLPAELTEEIVLSFLEDGAGKIIFEDEDWLFISGYRKTSIELPVKMLDALRDFGKKDQLNTNEVIEQAIEKFLKEQQKN